MRRIHLLKSLIATFLLCAATMVTAASDIKTTTIKLTMDINQLQQQAQLGNQQAQFELALALSSGTNIERNDSKAIYWYQQAAEQGMIEAQYSLALMIQFGQGQPADKTQAAQLHEKAAKQGHVGAQYALGLMYMQGHGVTADPIKTWVWLALAAENGYEDAFAIRDALKLNLSTSAYEIANQSFTKLKSQLPKTRQSSILVLAAAGN